MGRTALYRKYRSKNLGEIIGQEHITTVLDAAIKSGKISHAYLFTGQRGTGKTSVARILAHEVNEIPYGQESFDIIEIDAASHGLKEDIKELIEKSVIAPIKDKYKVYIIDEVHSMKHDAFNTFLKLLEEPPEHVIFILATTDPQKLPQTILSRTQRYHFRPVDIEKVSEHLKSIAKKEKIDITDDAIKIIAERGEGSFRDSIVLLDQLSGLGRKVDGMVVEEILGLAPTGKINSLVKSVIDKNSTEVISIVNELKQSGISGRTVVDQLIKKLLVEANNRPVLFDLINKLVDCVDSFDIYLKLLAILASYSSVGAKYVAPKESAVTPPKTVISEKQSEIKKEILKDKEKEEKKVVEEKKPESKKEETKPATNGTPPENINWEEFVETAKKINMTCGGSLSSASYDYDGKILTLYFKSKIFRTRMNDIKWKSILRNSLIELYETPPEIEISDGLKPKNEALSSVADIMGGGEVL